MDLRGLLLLPILLSCIHTLCDKNLVADLSFRINGHNLQFPCDSTRNIYLSSDRYVSKNVIGTRLQIYRDEAVVALPRYKHGVPFTLARFSLKSRGCVATLTPFPCWSLQEEGNCEAVQSAVDVFLDQNDILWVLDSGIVNTLQQPVRRCPPKVVGIDMKTAQVVKVVDLAVLVVADTRLQHLVVDYSPEGRPFVYVSDAGGAALIVYNVLESKGHRIALPDDVSKHCHKDVLYLMLVRKPCGNVVYFTYLSSCKLFSVTSESLQNGQATGAIADVGDKPDDAKIVLLGTDNGAAIFFRYKAESDIYIWNTETVFQTDNFLLVQKGDECRLATQVVPGYKRLMWTIESNFHDYIADAVGCLGATVVIHPLVKTCD